MFRKGKIGWTIWNIVEGLLLITAGLLFCIYSKNTDFQATCILIVAILVIVDAALRLTLNVISVFGLGDLKLIKTDFAAAVSGTGELSLGIGLIFLQQDFSKGEILFEAIGRFVGIFLIVLAAIVAIYGIVYIVKKLQGMGVSIAYFIFAAICLTLGILALIYLTKGENVRMFFFIAMGIILLVAGISVIYLTIEFLVEIKKTKKVVKEVVHDVIEGNINEEVETNVNEETDKKEDEQPNEEK